MDETIDKVNTEHSQLLSVLAAIELDIANIYFRVSIKHANKIKNHPGESLTNGIKHSELEGLSSTVIQKLGLMAKPNQTANEKKIKELQSTLVNANMIPPSKPSLHRAEQKLLEYNQKNPYMFSLLLINLAAANSSSDEKKYFLK